jgi:hypothetical protein
MEQLLRITTIRGKYELQITHPMLKYSSDNAQIEINREKGGLTINNQPTKLSIDTYNARNSVCPTTMESVRQAAQAGLDAASETTARYTKEGALLLDPNVSNPLDQIIKQRNQLPTGEFELKFLPTTGPDIEWSDPNLEMEYQKDKLSFDLKIQHGDVEFIPGDVELTITQEPKVEIEYVGKPIYVPPSVAEKFNHTPVNVLA